jgi:hypothetical protein
MSGSSSLPGSSPASTEFAEVLTNRAFKLSRLQYACCFHIIN